MEDNYLNILPIELCTLIFYYIEDDSLSNLDSCNFRNIFKDRYTFINKLKYNYPNFTILSDSYIMSAFSNDIQKNIKVYILIKSLLNVKCFRPEIEGYEEIVTIEIISNRKSLYETGNCIYENNNYINITISNIEQTDFKMFKLSEYHSKILNNKINDKIRNKSIIYINIYSLRKEYHIVVCTNNPGKSLIFKSDLSNIIDFLFNLIKMNIIK